MGGLTPRDHWEQCIADCDTELANLHAHISNAEIQIARATATLAEMNARVELLAGRKSAMKVAIALVDDVSVR